MINHREHEICAKFITGFYGGVVIKDHGQESDIARITFIRDVDADVWLIISACNHEGPVRLCIKPQVLFDAVDNYREVDGE